MPKIFYSQRSEKQKSDSNQLVNTLNQAMGIMGRNLYHAPNVDFLKNQVRELITKTLNPDYIAIVGDQENTPYSSLREISLNHFRPFYIPEHASKLIYTSDKPTSYIEQYNCSEFGINPKNLPPEYESVLIAPIKATPKDESIKPARGAIILARKEKNGFDPLVDLEFIHLLSCNLAMAILNSGHYL